MGEGTPTAQEVVPADISAGHGHGQNPRSHPQTKGGKTLGVGRIFIRTVRHFWPELGVSMRSVPDTRFEPFVDYDKRFLLWWGLLLFVLKLGSRRQLDYELRDLETCVLDNVNRLANTTQQSLPVHKTLEHFLGHVGSVPLRRLRRLFIRRLIRMKAIDACRLGSVFVVAVDGTGYLRFKHKHCSRCLSQDHNGTIVYFHPVLEAKLVDSCGLALSMATEFIENTHGETALQSYEQVKQDCELRAFVRLATQLKSDFPQTPLCISADSEFACGPGMHICKQHGWSFVFVFNPGRTPALWEDFVGLLKLEHGNCRRVNIADKGVQHYYRWVNNLRHVDTEGREHRVSAIICEETQSDETKTFAWITDMSVQANNVVNIAQRAGRVRSKIENQGFNVQKNSGFNMEHAYSHAEDTLKSCYLLLQIAHIILQMVEKGNLLNNLAKQYATTIPALLGSVKNLSRRLLECVRYFRIPDDAYDLHAASRCQIRLDTS
jgi:hypothetical protein